MEPNWKLKTLSRKPTREEIVERLLTLQREQNKWLDEAQASGHLEINEPISQDYLLVDVALDLLGVPPENVPIEPGEQVVGEEFSRYWLMDLYDIMFVGHNDAQGFIEVASGRREMPGQWTPESIEAWFYGER